MDSVSSKVKTDSSYDIKIKLNNCQSGIVGL